MSEKPMTVGELNDAIEAMGLEREDCACCALQGLYNMNTTLRKENEELRAEIARLLPVAHAKAMSGSTDAAIKAQAYEFHVREEALKARIAELEDWINDLGKPAILTAERQRKALEEIVECWNTAEDFGFIANSAARIATSVRKGDGNQKAIEHMINVEYQIEKLANFIMAEIEGEPSQSESAVDTAIRLLTLSKFKTSELL